jgi:hypothetical protein
LKAQLDLPLGSTSLAWLMHALVSDGWDSPGDLLSQFERPLNAAISRMEVTGVNSHRANLLMLALRLRESVLLDVPPMPWHDTKDEIEA